MTTIKLSQVVIGGARSAAGAQHKVAVVCSCFFFSSRRRHTRLQGDWSSDVCSYDLWPPGEMIERLASYANEHGTESGWPYYSLDGHAPVTGKDWDALRHKWRHAHGIDRKSVV